MSATPIKMEIIPVKQARRGAAPFNTSRILLPHPKTDGRHAHIKNAIKINPKITANIIPPDSLKAF